MRRVALGWEGWVLNEKDGRWSRGAVLNEEWMGVERERWGLGDRGEYWTKRVVFGQKGRTWMRRVYVR